LTNELLGNVLSGHGEGKELPNFHKFKMGIYNYVNHHQGLPPPGRKRSVTSLAKAVSLFLGIQNPIRRSPPVQSFYFYNGRESEMTNFTGNDHGHPSKRKRSLYQDLIKFVSGKDSESYLIHLIQYNIMVPLRVQSQFSHPPDLTKPLE